MRKKLSESQSNEVEYLNKKCRLILEYLANLSGSDVLTSEFKTVINSLYNNKNINGLRAAVKDLDNWVAQLSKDEYIKLKKKLDSDLELKDNEENVSDEEELNKIIKRGKINSEREYRIVLDKVERTYEDKSKKNEVEKLRAAEKINYPKLRRMLVRIQGAASGAYRDIHRLPQRRRRAKRQASWDNSFFPRPLIVF